MDGWTELACLSCPAKADATTICIKNYRPLRPKITHLEQLAWIKKGSAFGFRRRSSKWIFKIAAGVDILDLGSDYFSDFLSASHPLCPTNFRVNWSFSSVEEIWSRLSRWQAWQPSWTSTRNNFSYFWSTSFPDIKFWVNWPFSSREDVKNRFLRWQLSCIMI